MEGFWSAHPLQRTPRIGHPRFASIEECASRRSHPCKLRQDGQPQSFGASGITSSVAPTWRQNPVQPQIHRGRCVMIRQPLDRINDAMARGPAARQRSQALSPSFESSILPMASLQNAVQERLHRGDQLILGISLLWFLHLRGRHVGRLGAERIVEPDDVHDQVNEGFLIGRGLVRELVGRAWLPQLPRCCPANSAATGSAARSSTRVLSPAPASGRGIEQREWKFARSTARHKRRNQRQRECVSREPS